MTGRTSPRLAFRQLAALRSGTALAAALALGGTAAPALADGFNGTIASSTGVTVISPTEYQIDGAEGVINWNAAAATAGDTNVDFLSAGQTVTFHDPGSSFTDFTVLNRVVPTFGGAAIPATISLSGTVSSLVTGKQGGNVWFYSPYGIIANGTASFTVGSLLLTTSDIALGPNGSLYLDQSAGNQIGFQQASQPGSFVRILPGATISASNNSVNNAYVGVFAPRIEQGGSIRSDGMTALVAGEAGSITFNAGLVNIAVDVGTGDANGIVHTGSTGGAASLDGEAKTVAMVAMSKNTALTMLLGGSIGYDPAAVGITDGAGVVLYAGKSAQVDAAQPDPLRLTVSGPANASTGTIAIGNTVFGSQLAAYATGAIDVAPVYSGPTSPGLVDFQQTANLVAGGSISLTAQAGESILARDSLFLAPLLKRQGENVTITVSGDPTGTVPTPGDIGVTNAFTIDARGLPDPNAQVLASTGADGNGGAVNIAVSRGGLSAGQGLTVLADGRGENGVLGGGKGTGGTIDIGVADKGTISGTSLYASASGFGGSASGIVTAGGGTATGGDGSGNAVTLHDDGGTLRFGDVTIYADGKGGSGADVTGNAAGGKAAIRIAGASQNWNSLSASASAIGGGLVPGSTAAGSATARNDALLLAISGSGALTTNFLSLDSYAYVSAGSAQAHSATGGGIDVQVGGGGLTVTNPLFVNADADITPETLLGTLDVAPAMSGGRINVVADGGTITTDMIAASASARGVAGLSAGALAKGGSVSVGAINGGAIALTGPDAAIFALAEGYGAVGPAASDARGGDARVYVDNGTIGGVTGGANLIAVSGSALAGGLNYGGFDGNGFNASGKTAALEVLAGGGSITTAEARVYAKGEASLATNPIGFQDLTGLTGQELFAIGGNGGTGTGGTARVNVFGGTLDAATLVVRGSGIGGASDMSTAAGAFQSGSGAGGFALVSQSAGVFKTTTLDVQSGGIGGGIIGASAISALAAAGGSASGGTARVTLSGGALTVDPLGTFTIDARANGGAGMASGDTANGANGGAASNAAAVAELLMPLGSTASLSAPALAIYAGANGGRGGDSVGGLAGNGGAATGGTARINMADGAIAVPGVVTVIGDATGGTGNTGGNATGGTAGFLLTDSLAVPAVTRSLGVLRLNADGFGGFGGTPATNGTSTAGTTKFTAQPGRAASALAITGNFSALARGTIAPAGDGFTGNFGAVPVTVGGSAIVLTDRDITATTLAGGGLAVTGTLDLIGRAITVSGPGVLSAGGNVQVLARSAISLGGLSSGGTTLLSAQDPVSLLYGPITVSNLSSAGLVTVRSSAFNAVSPGALTFAPSFAATGGFAVQSAGNLTVGTVNAGGALSLASTGGALAIGGQQTASSIVLGAGGNIAVNAPLVTTTSLAATAGGTFTATLGLTIPGSTSIDAAGGITIPSLTSGAATLLRATGGAISVPQLLSVGPVTLLGRSATIGSTGALTFASATTTAGDLLVTTGGNLVIGTGDATGAVTLTSAGGTVAVTNLNATGPVTASGSGVSIGSTGSLSFANSAASGGAFAVTAAGNLTFANVTAPGALTLQAGGFAAFNGIASGATVAVSSGDIRIGNGGRLGIRGVTSTLALTNTAPAAGTAIGGTGATSGWSLDAAEALRLFADQSIAISVPAAATNPADVVIGNLALTYGAGASAAGPGANIGAGGTFAVATPGRIRVTGAVAPVMASNADVVSLTAGSRIDVVTDAGSIVLRGANGALTGTLRMTAPTVRAATTSALAALDAITSLPAATQRLAQNDGVLSDAGKLQANALAFTVAASTLYIQNTGVNGLFANRRGFTANALSITRLNGASPSFAINGVILNANGAPITGLDTYQAITVNGVPAAVGGPFNPSSSVNGCPVGVDCGIPVGQILPPHETIKELVGILRPGGGVDALRNLPLVQYGETPLLNSPPLIDEPVTGVGNDDLWLRRCGADKDCTE